MNKIAVTTTCEKNRIVSTCEPEDKLEKYFRNKEFFTEYSHSLHGLPASIAVIPILGTLLPFAWLINAEIIVDEIDEDLYRCLPRIKKGYQKMYPQIKFGGKLSANKIVKNCPSSNVSSHSATLFSGGLDAFHTLFSHLDESPVLITVWGADLRLHHDEGWSKVQAHVEQTAEEYGLDRIIVKAPVLGGLLNGKISNYTKKKAGVSWWYGFQHGLSMLALTAPMAYTLGFDRIYIASSNTKKYKNITTCASDPLIDNHVRFCGCRVFHDGYQYDRQQKTRNVCEFSKTHNKKIALRVCYEIKDGTNCCQCEKCRRTMLALYAEGENPEDYGFSYNPDELASQIKDYLIDFNDTPYKLIYYKQSQTAMRKNFSPDTVKPEFAWFYETKIKVPKIKKQKTKKTKIILRRGIKYAKRKIKRLLAVLNIEIKRGRK